MISLLHPMFQPYVEPRRDQALDPDAVKDAVKGINPKTLLEWIALISAGLAGFMWAWRKLLKNICSNLWEIMKIGATAKLLREGQERLREQVSVTDARTKLIMNNRLDVGIWESEGGSGKCVFANRKMLDALGGGFEMVAGDNWHSIIADEDRERVFKEWQRCVEQGTDFNMEYEWKRPHDGSLIPVRVWGQRITDGEKTIRWICEVTFLF
jgi:PAS domain S-box-containing protein